MKHNFKVYLSGPITGLTYSDSVEWTNYAREILASSGIWGYRPLRGKEEAFHLTEKIASVVTKQRPLVTSKGIYGRDLYDVMSCDCVLVNLLGAKKVSIGTMFEMAWTSFLLKPLVLVIEDEGNVHEHSFIHEALTHRTNNLDIGIDLVKSILLPD